MAQVALWKGQTPTGRAVASKDDPTRLYRPVSRWIEIKEIYVTARHRLWDYAIDDQPYVDEDLHGRRRLEYFKYKGRPYVLGQFMRFGYPNTYTIDLEDGSCLEAYDATQFYKPYLLEFIGEEGMVRLWEQVEKGAEA